MVIGSKSFIFNAIKFKIPEFIVSLDTFFMQITSTHPPKSLTRDQNS